MVFSADDRVLIKLLRQGEGCGVRILVYRQIS